METIILDRLETSDEGTFGQMIRQGHQIADTCELPWKENMNRISCIPKGTYKVVRRDSEKFGKHFHVLDVPNRDFILIHPGNTIMDILGCIAVGSSRGEVKGRPAVINSRNTMASLLTYLPLEFYLEVKGVCG